MSKYYRIFIFSLAFFLEYTVLANDIICKVNGISISRKKAHISLLFLIDKFEKQIARPPTNKEIEKIKEIQQDWNCFLLSLQVRELINKDTKKRLFSKIVTNKEKENYIAIKKKKNKLIVSSLKKEKEKYLALKKSIDYFNEKRSNIDIAFKKSNLAIHEREWWEKQVNNKNCRQKIETKLKKIEYQILSYKKTNELEDYEKNQIYSKSLTNCLLRKTIEHNSNLVNSLKSANKQEKIKIEIQIMQDFYKKQIQSANIEILDTYYNKSLDIINSDMDDFIMRINKNNPLINFTQYLNKIKGKKTGTRK